MDTAIYTPRPCCYPSDLSAANQTGFKSDVNETWKCRGRIQAWSLAASYLPLPHQPRVPFSKPPSSLANTTTSGSGSNYCPMGHPTQVRSQISRVKCYKPHWIPNKVLHRYRRHTTALKHAQTALPRHQHAIYYKARATHHAFCPHAQKLLYTRGLVAFLLLQSTDIRGWTQVIYKLLSWTWHSWAEAWLPISTLFFASRGWAESQGVSFLKEQQLIYCLVQSQSAPPGTERAAQRVFQQNELSDTRPTQVCLTARTEFTVHTLLFLYCSVIIWGHNLRQFDCIFPLGDAQAAIP